MREPSLSETPVAFFENFKPLNKLIITHFRKFFNGKFYGTKRKSREQSFIATKLPTA